MSRASSSPGVSTFWGGRLAQALERDPAVEAIIGVSPDDPTCELERTEFVRVGTQHALLRRIVQRGGDRHGGRHAAGRRLASRRPPRAAHEANVIGTMNILAACGGPDSPVRKVVFKSSAHYYGCERDDPAFFTEAHAAPAPAAHARWSATSSRPRRPSRAFAERNPDVTVTDAALRQRRSGPTCGRATRALLSLPAVPCILGFDPRYQFIHEDDIVGVLEHAVARRPARRLQRRRRRRARALGGRVPARQAARADPAAVGDRAGRGARCAALGVRVPPEMLAPAALRPRRSTTASSRPRAAPLRHTTRETVAGVRRGTCGSRRCAAARRAPYRYEREVEEFLRYSPSVRRRESTELTASEIAGARLRVRHPSYHRFGTVRSRSFFIVATLVVLLVARGRRRLRVRLRP